MSSNDHDNDDTIKKAGDFFSKKLQKEYKIDEDFHKEKFRDLDNESLRISKIKARINFLRAKENDNIKNLNEKSNEETKNHDNENIYVKKDSILFEINDSKKNVDFKNNPIKNFILKQDPIEKVKISALKDFEINSILIHSGKIVEVPKFLLLEFLSNGFGRLLNKHERKKFNNTHSFKVQETFGLSELKKSRLNNDKKFSEN